MTEDSKKNEISDEMVKITFYAPSSLRKAFKSKTAAEGKSIKDTLCLLMKEYAEDKIKFKEV